MDLERYIGKYLSFLILSYNPSQYEKLMARKLREYFKFFLKTLIIGMVIFTIALIAMTVNYVGGIPEKLDSVERLEIGGVVSTNQSIMVITDPDIVLDLDYNGTKTKHEVIFSQRGIHYPRFLFFGKTFVSWGELKDFKTETPARDHFIYGIILFLLPSILFWFFIISLIKLFLVFLVLVLIGHYLPRFFKHKLPFSYTVRLAILTMPSVTIIGLGFHPMGTALFWWGALLTAAFYTIGVMLLCERIIRHRQGFSKEKRRRKKSKV